MIDMKEKLVELIDEVQDEGCDYTNCLDRYDKPDYIENSTLADHLIENGVTVQEWISVKDVDRLPKENEAVLVYVYMNGESVKAKRRGNKWYSTWDNVTEIVYVSHWMPMPEPPKGE